MSRLTKPATPLLGSAPGGLLFDGRAVSYALSMLRPFTKPSLTVQDQITLLEQRGMAIADRAAAEHALTHIGYYRLRAYWYPFEINPSDPAHKLREGTSFEEVLALYDFDRRLRLQINDAIERVEVAARGAWAHHLALAYGTSTLAIPAISAI